MILDILLPLLGLALVDSTSIGTLLIPLWLLSRSRLNQKSIGIYLITITVFYFLLGVALFYGVDFFKTLLAAPATTQMVNWLQLFVGAALLILSFKPNRPKDTQQEGKIAKLRTKLASADSSTVLVIGLALTAGLLEAATMLPYLAAIGILVNANSEPITAIGVLAVYCVVMILPALILFGLRLAMRAKIEPKIAAMERWATRHLTGSTAWLIGIAGFLIARDALWRLGFFDLIIPGS
ncbi:MAG TPA: GAP family protein [Verrucomicrobiae bacterium]|nr:GAP family protein [Verrucomicrobiae bacterium]